MDFLYFGLRRGDKKTYTLRPLRKPLRSLRLKRTNRKVRKGMRKGRKGFFCYTVPRRHLPLSSLCSLCNLRVLRG